MSERRYDTSWVRGVAATRGLAIGEEDAAELAALVAPILEHFASITSDLTADEDMYEFRRILARGAPRA